jgi:glucuronoarabinoxylan endo-1,4-beta-xylanase
VPLPAHSLNTYILNIDKGTTAIEPLKLEDDALTPKTYYDLQGRRLESPSGLCIERSANGRSRKIYFK